MPEFASQIKKLVEELVQYQGNDKKLQPENDIEKYFVGLIKKDNSYLKNRNQELTTQINELKDEKQCNQQIVQDLKKNSTKTY